MKCLSFPGRTQHSLISSAIAIVSASLLFSAEMPKTVSAVERWADPNLTVLDGLELWLDANRAAGEEPTGINRAVSQWRDASGKGRHLKQVEKQSQPLLFKVGELAAVHFDGVDDSLRAVNQATELTSFTVVIIAAPRLNGGAFCGFLAFSAANKRDYTSGLAVDLGPAATTKFSALNVEGRGFGGAQSLRTKASPFGRLDALVISSDVDQGTVGLAVNGESEGQRKRDGRSIAMDEITLGARYFNNEPGPQRPNGFVRADIAEVLVYNRVLKSTEIESLQRYLDTKYARVRDAPPTIGEQGSEPLVPVSTPPAVQMFLPGFSVRELPVELTNINNVKYRPDGTLVALAYDGKVWLLRDTNGDGLEDKTVVFWDNPVGLRAPAGIDLTPSGYKLGDGLFVVGKTRCLLIVDTDGDDRADKEIEVSGGWKESEHTVHGLGVAFDSRDGSVYYGRGTYNFVDPYLRDKDGRSHYSLNEEAGTIVHVSPDFKTREIVATGIRFPVAIRLNRSGDLFATDQEGATWVPNGNPFDELLHIQPGRHYGFPPRHPKYLPDVIDEPSIFDYGPQHQSTCGLNFNEPLKPNGPVFGPAWWTGSAIVTGFSRGKLFRTKLVKSSTGYVAANQIMACLKMMPADACISPSGDLLVSCHSGGPDWGSGPTGTGKLFKISYTDGSYPQPVFVWPSGPREIRIEFDRPLDPDQLRDMASTAKLTAGRYVRAGDRFESFWPGYAAVQAQKLAPRYNVPIRSAQLLGNRRTLLLATDPIDPAVHYALTLPDMSRPPVDKLPDDILPQQAAIDLDFDLSGCEATWTQADDSTVWKGWLPHLDLEVSRKLTSGSATHHVLWEALSKPGTLTLRTNLDLTDMLRPAVQPGSVLDYKYPPEAVTVTFVSQSPATHLQLSGTTDEEATSDGHSVSFTLDSKAEKIVPVKLQIKSESGTPGVAVSWTTNEDARPRPLPLRRMFVPWANTKTETFDPASVALAPELEGGSWARGRKEFFGQEAACSKCHTIHGRGGAIGPNLSNLTHRDYQSVLRDIVNPSFAINPDHVTYTILLDDGRVLSGVVHPSQDVLSIGDTNGSIVHVARSQVDSMKPSSISTMPEGLTKRLGADRLRDLMTFLLTPPPHMPPNEAGPPPPPRTVAEVEAVLAGAPEPADPIRPIRVVLVAGPKDHGPGEHDYPTWQRTWAELLSAADKIDVSQAWEWPTKEQIKRADVVVLYQQGNWNKDRAADVDALLKRGGGLVCIHWAINGRDHCEDFATRIGLAAGGSIAYRHGDVTLRFNRQTENPIIRNLNSLSLHDETYWRLTGSVPAQSVLATAIEEDHPQPQVWVAESAGGRIFVSIPGHFSTTFDDPLFRVLLLRGIAWTAREPVDRFNELVWPGSNVAN